MTNLLLACAGGALGAGARYLVGLLALAWFGPTFPWATLIVNVVGSFLMGAMAHYVLVLSSLPAGVRVFVLTGVLGGFTTFSAYALDVVTLVERGQPTAAIVYAIASVVGAIAALVAGLAFARVILP